MEQYQEIRSLIVACSTLNADQLKTYSAPQKTFAEFKILLNEGKIRAAEPDATSLTG
jgi:2,3,4,5-tetrahydropyridine-2-carboxylate N-succinyltransferase